MKALQQEMAEMRKKQDKRLEFQLIETPDIAEEEIAEEETDLASDKNMKAADVSDEQLDIGAPFSEGQIDWEAFAGDNQQMQSDVSKPVEIQQEDVKSEEHELSNLEKKQAKETEIEPQNMAASEPTKLQKLLFNNVKTRALEEGGLSFNTYAWDYAPYMLALKREIESHLDLPYAFTHMGMIGGDVLIGFVVNRDGTLVANVIVDTNAHESLQQASKISIDKSFPFLPLPEDFPEERLEVKARFRYINRRE